MDIFRNRIEYDEPLANPLKKLYHEKRDDSEKVRFAININKQKDSDANGEKNERGEKNEKSDKSDKGEKDNNNANDKRTKDN